MLRKDPDQKKASPGSDKKVAWPDLSAGGGCLSPNLGLSPLPLALGPATGSSTTASTLPPGRLSGRTRGAETLKSQANQKMKKVRSIKKKSGRTRGVETNNSNKHQSTTINCNKYSEQIIKYQIPQG